MERVGAQWDRLHHAQLMAALLNGPSQRQDKRAWQASDFMPADPWAPPPPALGEGSPGQLAAIFGAQ